MVHHLSFLELELFTIEFITTYALLMTSSLLRANIMCVKTPLLWLVSNLAFAFLASPPTPTSLVSCPKMFDIICVISHLQEISRISKTFFKRFDVVELSKI